MIRHGFWLSGTLRAQSLADSFATTELTCNLVHASSKPPLDGRPHARKPCLEWRLSRRPCPRNRSNLQRPCGPPSHDSPHVIVVPGPKDASYKYSTLASAHPVPAVPPTNPLLPRRCLAIEHQILQRISSIYTLPPNPSPVLFQTPLHTYLAIGLTARRPRLESTHHILHCSNLESLPNPQQFFPQKWSGITTSASSVIARPPRAPIAPRPAALPTSRSAATQNRKHRPARPRPRPARGISNNRQAVACNSVCRPLSTSTPSGPRLRDWSHHLSARETFNRNSPHRTSHRRVQLAPQAAPPPRRSTALPRRRPDPRSPPSVRPPQLAPPRASRTRHTPSCETTQTRSIMCVTGKDGSRCPKLPQPIHHALTLPRSHHHEVSIRTHQKHASTKRSIPTSHSNGVSLSRYPQLSSFPPFVQHHCRRH